MNSAQEKYDTACADVENDPAVKEAQKNLDDARNAQQQAQDALDAAKKDAEQVVADKKIGTAGFFRWLGDEKNDADAKRAYELLTTGKYTNSSGTVRDFTNVPEDNGFFAETKLNAEGDATTLKNLKTSLDHIDRGNELRKSDNNLGPQPALKINSLLMSASEIQTNASDAVIKHRAHIVGSENLAWGGADPYYGWYTEEKELYDSAPKGPKVKRDEDGNIIGTTGHYENLMSDEYGLTGFAYVTKGGNVYGDTFGQVFDWTEPGDADPVAPSYTTDEYRTLIGDYEKYLSEGTSKVDKAQSDLSSAKADVTAAEKALEDAQANADQACSDAKTARDKAQKNLDSATTDLDEKKADADAAKSATDDAATKRDAAKDALKAAQDEQAKKDAAVTSAEEDAKAANTEVEEAQSELDKAEKALADATPELSDLRKAYEDARDKADSADEAVATAKTALAEAKGNAEGSEQAVKDAETALADAQRVLTDAQADRDALVDPAKAYEDALAAVKKATDDVRKAQEALDAYTEPGDDGQKDDGKDDQGSDDGQGDKDGQDDDGQKGEGDSNDDKGTSNDGTDTRADDSNGKTTDSDSQALPRTGASVVPMALLGLALIAGGAVMLRVRRRNG